MSVATSHCNAQTITVTVTVTNVTDDQGNTLASASVTYGKLVGDVTGNGKVGNEDVGAARNNSGRVNSTNFRADVNGDGSVNKMDLRVIKANRGHSL
ncbi:MAG: dockerin type I domain-containing protein [Spartobacteria bacterium]